MTLASAWFRLRSKKSLPLLEGKVSIMTQSQVRQTPMDFYCLGKDLEAYRDLVRDHLDTLNMVDRGTVEDELWPGVHALVEGVNKLADEGLKAGNIDEALAHHLGLMGNSLLFVVVFSKLGTEPTKNFNPRRR